MKAGRALAAAMTLATLTTLTGCATLRENRPLCMGVAIGTGTALGGTLGALLVSEVANHGDSGGSKGWEIAGGGLGGMAAGGLIGWGIAEALCEEPAPPPPPPAPPAAKTPPPPPPTERRGG